MGMAGKSHSFTDQTNKPDTTKMSPHFSGSERERDPNRQTTAGPRMKLSQTQHLQSYNKDTSCLGLVTFLDLCLLSTC